MLLATDALISHPEELAESSHAGGRTLSIRLQSSSAKATSTRWWRSRRKGWIGWRS